MSSARNNFILIWNYCRCALKVFTLCDLLTTYVGVDAAIRIRIQIYKGVNEWKANLVDKIVV